MEMSLGLFDEKKREVRRSNFFEFDCDNGHEEEVGVPVSRIAQILRVNSVVRELESKITSYVD
jgi:phosphoribosylformylglycinamidine (FGAM) synthase PurS component